MPSTVATRTPAEALAAHADARRRNLALAQDARLARARARTKLRRGGPVELVRVLDERPPELGGVMLVDLLLWACPRYYPSWVRRVGRSCLGAYVNLTNTLDQAPRDELARLAELAWTTGR